MDEIEVKFILDSPEAVRGCLIDMGAKPKQKVFEYNLRFDDKNGSLIEKKCLLRLRKDSKIRLTFKSPPECLDPQFKIYQELEVTVSDFDLMMAILKHLGYEPVQSYEKHRESFELPGVEVCIDILPFGNFIEIEGEKNAIKQVSEQIGLCWDKRILMNYLELFELIKQKFNLPFTDVTFKNFEGYQIDFQRVSLFN